MGGPGQRRLPRTTRRRTSVAAEQQAEAAAVTVVIVVVVAVAAAAGQLQRLQVEKCHVFHLPPCIDADTRPFPPVRTAGTGATCGADCRDSKRNGRPTGCSCTAAPSASRTPAAPLARFIDSRSSCSPGKASWP